MMIKDKVIEKRKKKLAELQVRKQPGQSLEEVLHIDINEEFFRISIFKHIIQQCSILHYQ